MKATNPTSRAASSTFLFVLFCALLAGAAGADTGLAAAPDFLIRDCVYADSIALADNVGSPLLLVFYDGGMVTNMNTLRYAKEWDRRYKGDGLRVICIHSPFFEPSKIKFNATEVIGRLDVKLPVGMDMDREVYNLYELDSLPAFVLIRPDGKIAHKVAGEKVYAEAELAVQDELKRLQPGIILPLISKPLKPWDDPDARLFPATPMTVLGHRPGNIANADSSLHGQYGGYEDLRERTKDVVYLNGKWKVGDLFVAHSDSIGGLDSHIRIIYRGKTVWVLPAFELGTRPRIYIKQDRSYLVKDSWGKDVMGDQQGRPQIHLQYSIPYEIVSNPSYGVHQLELIPGEGDVSFYYLFFEGDVQK